MAKEKDYVLQVKHLATKFRVGKKIVNSVNDASFNIERGTTLGIVGESGCGKSVTATSIMQLLPKYGNITNGEILFNPGDGREVMDLAKMDRKSKEMRSLRGKDISMIFQDPLSSLDPVYTIGTQIMENLMNHETVTKEEGKERVIKLLKELGIPAPEQRFDGYPHEFSGGMKQRVMIAMGMICNPTILIADEPTTALDVTIQAQILKLIKEMQKEYGTSVMLITHNMGIVAEVCDQVAVMYMGRVVEFGNLEQIFNNPKHPYTAALLRSVPVLGMGKDAELESIDGSTPDASDVFEGCEFEPRCTHACEKCRLAHPEAREIEEGHIVRCWLFENEGEKVDE